MSQKDKLLDRLKSRPRDFQWSELETLLGGFGYELERGSGSRRKFWNPQTDAIISIHEPHPVPVLKAYQIKEIINHLRERGLL
jgi:HicA toxin of bacterial toxin-antitoxin,